MSPRRLHQDLWNVLHDGTIDSISGTVPGEIQLRVGITYLRELFGDPGESILITLHDCTRVSFKDCDTPGTITDLAAIATLELEILSTEVDDQVFCTYCIYGTPNQTRYGTLAFEAAGFSLALDTGRPIELEDLFTVATTYWTAFGNQNP